MAKDTYTFIENEQEYTIVLYSGITNKLLNVMGGIMNVDLLLTDDDLQEKFIKVLLTKFDDEGNSVGYIFPPFKLSNENRASLITWGYENVTDFLLEIAKKSVEQVKKMAKTKKDLEASVNG